ncbi:MAG: sodium/proline symporter PutP [Clostridia bacterium]|nr:sodium/proline symporter PutP [Clostridia bacterium]
MTGILIIFILYLALMLGIGFWFNRKKLNLNEYLLGDRQLNPWVTAMSAQASDMSGWLLTGLPGLAYAGSLFYLGISGADYGIQEAFWTAVGLGIGTVLNWLLVARRLRVYTEVSNNSLTIPSYLQNRFKDKKGIICVVTGIVIVFFFTVYTSSMFSAGAKLFSNIFELDYTLALIIGAVVIVGYTFLGGFLAVSWTDLIQGLLMFFCLVFVPVFMFFGFDGMQSELLERVMSAFGELLPQADGTGYSWSGIIGAIAWGLGYCGMPHILVRFMACKDKRTIKPAATIAIVWVAITMAAAILIGVLGGVYLSSQLTILGDSEQVFMQVVKNLFPPVVAGVMLSAILAAIMSTADSQLLVASSSFATDIFKRLIKKDATEKQVLLVSKISMVVIAAIALVIALDPDSSVFDVVSYAWAGLGASFGPIIFISLYSKKVTCPAAIAGICTGAGTTLLFKYVLAQFGGIWAIYEILPGFILSTIVILVVSKFTKTTPEMEAEFDEMKRLINEDDKKEEIVA